MIRGTSGHTAHQFETLAGIHTRPQFSNKNLYIIDGAPGVWRQVAAPGVSDFAHLAVVAAGFGGGKIFLRFDVMVNAELDVAGLRSAVADADTPPELAAAIALAKKLAAENPTSLLTAAAGEGGEETTDAAAARQPRRRAAGGVVTISNTGADGTPAEGSIIAPMAQEAAPSAAPPPAAAPAPATAHDPGPLAADTPMEM